MSLKHNMQNSEYTTKKNHFMQFLKLIRFNEKYTADDVINKGKELGFTPAQIKDIWRESVIESQVPVHNISKKQTAYCYDQYHKNIENNAHCHSKGGENIRNRLRAKLEMRK